MCTSTSGARPVKVVRPPAIVNGSGDGVKGCGRSSMLHVRDSKASCGMVCAGLIAHKVQVCKETRISNARVRRGMSCPRASVGRYRRDSDLTVCDMSIPCWHVDLFCVKPGVVAVCDKGVTCSCGALSGVSFAGSVV